MRGPRHVRCAGRCSLLGTTQLGSRPRPLKREIAALVAEYLDAYGGIGSRTRFRCYRLHLGGVRWLHRCPTCGGMATKLFRPAGVLGAAFACRRRGCWGVRYERRDRFARFARLPRLLENLATLERRPGADSGR